MTKPRQFRYLPLPDADERIRSSEWLTKSLAILLRENRINTIDEHKRDMLRHAICKITEAETGKDPSKNGSGKHGSRYCSESVWRDRDGLKENEQLDHEHVVPIRNLVHALLTCEADAIDAIIKKAMGCVVYKSEHPRKVGDRNDLDGWAR